MKFQNMVYLVVGIIFAAFGHVAATTPSTSAQSIGTVSVEASGPNYYAKTTDNNGIWATSTCTTPIQFLWIKPTTGGSKEMLSLLLTAKSTGLKIAADGACGTGGNAIFFEVTNLRFDP